MNTPSLRILFVVPLLCLCSTAHALIYNFSATLNGASESPPVVSAGTGSSIVTYNSVSQKLGVKIDFTGLTGTTTVVHIHAPTAVAGVGNVGVATFPGTFPDFPVGVTSGSYFKEIDLSQATSFTAGFLALGGGTTAGAQAALLDAMLSGKAYVNVHSTFAPGGEIRGFLVRVPDTSATALLLGGALVFMVSVGRRFAR